MAVRPWPDAHAVRVTSREKTNAEFTESDTASRLGLTDYAGNDLVSASFIAASGRRVSSHRIVSWYRYTDTLGAEGDFQDDSARSNAPDDSGFGRTQLAFTYDLAVRDVSVREEVGLEASDRHFLEAGFETHDLATSARWNLITGRNTSEANGSSARGGIGLPSQLDSTLESTRAGAWLIDRVRAATWLTIEPGLRLDWSSVTGETIVSPRVSEPSPCAPPGACARPRALHAKPGLREAAAGRLLRRSHVADEDGARERARGARARRGRARPRTRPARARRGLLQAVRPPAHRPPRDARGAGCAGRAV